MRALLGLFLAAFVAFDQAAAEVFGDLTLVGTVGGKRTLVLLDNFEIKETHSFFFGALADRGHELSFSLANSPDVVIYKYGRYLYDNLILFCPGTEDFTTLDAAGISNFVEKGGNLLLVADANASDLMRDIAGQFGVDFDRKKTRVIDHFSFEPALDTSLQHTAIVTSEALKNSQVLGKFASSSPKPVVYSGIGHAVDDDNILALKVLTGGVSSYSASPSKEVAGNLEVVGRETLLITAIQARNNARAAFAGSLSFFSNEYFDAKLSTTGKLAGNKELSLELTKWVFRERGILRASKVHHQRADGRTPDHLLAEKVKPDQAFSLFPDPELNRQSLVYRIKDDVVYSLVIEEYDAEAGGWQPFKADDVQMEFVMLDPYVRTFLSHDDKGRYSVQFTIPDVYGVYKFRILYRRPGYSTIAVNTPVSIRPFHHDEYERFILSAYPYYSSAFSMMAGFLVFGVFFLYSREGAQGSTTDKKKVA